jgi:hypothetical protein
MDMDINMLEDGQTADPDREIFDFRTAQLRAILTGRGTMVHDCLEQNKNSLKFSLHRQPIRTSAGQLAERTAAKQQPEPRIDQQDQYLMTARSPHRCQCPAADSWYESKA